MKTTLACYSLLLAVWALPASAHMSNLMEVRGKYDVVREFNNTETSAGDIDLMAGADHPTAAELCNTDNAADITVAADETNGQTAIRTVAGNECLVYHHPAKLLANAVRLNKNPEEWHGLILIEQVHAAGHGPKPKNR